MQVFAPDSRNQPGPRNLAGRTRVRTPLWTDARLEAAQRKRPQLPFAAWSAAVERLYEHKSSPIVAATAIASVRPISKVAGAGKRKVVSLGLPITTGKGTQRNNDTSYVAREPLPESFSPYDYLYRFYRGCVALVVIDRVTMAGDAIPISRTLITRLCSPPRHACSPVGHILAATYWVSTITGTAIIHSSGDA